MIKRGQREHDFCVAIVRISKVDGINDTVVDNGIYGPLFMEAIPEIFIPKGLQGTDYNKAVEHVKQLWTGQAAVKAEKIAKIVLDYHGQHVFWSSEIRVDKGKKKRHRKDDAGARQRKKHRATAVEKPRSKGALAHDVSDQVLSDSAAAQILNQMTQNANDDGHEFVSDPSAHIIDPIAREVESNSGPFHIQNAEDPSSARLSASSTGLDGPLFVYQNDPSLIIDESSLVQQPRARIFHHDQSESRALVGNELFRSTPASNDNMTGLICNDRHQANIFQTPSLPPLQVASSQWIPAGTAGSNPRLQSDKDESPSRQAILLTIRNQQAALATPLDSFSLPQSSDGSRQPARYPQQ
ncbi:hypothetical protein F66182_15164, partial [Fusarium sp. NRRL 66182]